MSSLALLIEAHQQVQVKHTTIMRNATSESYLSFARPEHLFGEKNCMNITWTRLPTALKIIENQHNLFYGRMGGKTTK